MIRYIRLIQHLSNWWLYLAVKLGMVQEDPITFKTRNRIIVEVPRRLLHEFKEIFMEGSYTRGLEHSLPDRPTIMDIGANAGFFTLFAAYRFPGAKIMAYEPIENNFKQLERNAALNRDARIRCFQKAVYGFSGQIELSFDPSDSFTTSASVFGSSNSQIQTIQVPCGTLQEIFDENQIDRCDLLKMDCEGAEYEILCNCSAGVLHRIDQMAIEVHGGTRANQNITALTDYFRSMDFNTRQYASHMLWAWRKK